MLDGKTFSVFTSSVSSKAKSVPKTKKADVTDIFVSHVCQIWKKVQPISMDHLSLISFFQK